MNQMFLRDQMDYQSAIQFRLNGGGNENTRIGQSFTGHNYMTAMLLQEIIDASGSSIAILDKYQTILWVNRVWRQFAIRTGSISQQFGIGCRYPDMGMGIAATSASDAVTISKGLDQVITKSEIEFNHEYQSTAVAEPIWFHLHAASFRFSNQDGDPLILVTHDDITPEKIARDLLIKDRERLGRLLAASNILPWEADPTTGLFTYIGEHAERILGYPGESWFEPDFWTSRIHPDDRERVVAESAERSQRAVQYQLEYRMISKDAHVVWINDNVSIHRENGVPTTMSGLMINITERKQAENTLKLLGGRLISAQEEERKRVARDLHDDLNQRMALLSIELEQIGEILPTDAARAGDRIKELQKRALKISREIHRMSYTLHPSKLDDLGLAPALRSFCVEFSEARGLPINFRQTGFPAVIPADTTLCLFRIAQEGLQNAAKHSGASIVDILLTKTDNSVELIISDPGCGFDVDNEKMNRGLGFISMRERLRLVNGDIRIQSKPSKGTQINISVPLRNTAGH